MAEWTAAESPPRTDAERPFSAIACQPVQKSNDAKRMDYSLQLTAYGRDKLGYSWIAVLTGIRMQANHTYPNTGCVAAIQGYIHAHPMPAEAFSD